jgi:hypothetical protein
MSRKDQFDKLTLSPTAVTSMKLVLEGLNGSEITSTLASERRLSLKICSSSKPQSSVRALFHTLFFALTSPPRIVYCFEQGGIEFSRARTCAGIEPSEGRQYREKKKRFGDIEIPQQELPHQKESD